MAKVYLRSDDGRDIIDLPPVCMKCGAPATVRKSKRFSWCPPWVPVLILGGLLPYLIVALILTKRQRVETPLCEQHKSYWWLYPTIMGLSALGLVGIGYIALIAMAVFEEGNGSGLEGLPCVGVILSLLVLIIVAAVLNITRIRPKEITDRRIILTAVAPEFVEAVEEEEENRRRAFERDDDDHRRPRRRQAEDDDRFTR